MSTISLCMIVKNEEDVLARCLDCVKDIVDEIIIVDTGSTDRTKEIALEYTDKIFDFEWIDDFSAARNYAFSKATMDYQFWLDADDVLTIDNQLKLKEVKEMMDGTVDCYSMQYHLSYDELGRPTFSYHRYRLVKREKNFKWIGFVHEFLSIGGNTKHTDIAISHSKPIERYSQEKSDRNLKIYEYHKENGHDFSSRDLFYYANELRDHRKLEEAVSSYQAFLTRPDGWVEDKIRACLYLEDCFKKLGFDNLLKDILMTTFIFDSPRPEACCKIGDIHKESREFAVAARWYELATLINEDHSQGFKILSYSTWYPHLQLSVCFWNLGLMERARKHHLLAKNYAPENQIILSNDQYFN